MGLFIKSYLRFIQELQVRQKLFSLRDWRVLTPVIGKTLRQAALSWPQILPRKWHPRSVLDLGAYKGNVARELSVLYHPSHMVMVEPQKELADQLGRELFAPNQKVFSFCVGKEKGLTVLKITKNLASSSCLDICSDAEKSYGCEDGELSIIKEEQVPVFSLDDIAEMCGFEELDLLKMDVHGYEKDVIDGGKRILRSVHVVVTEVMFHEHYVGQPMFRDIYDALRASGFELSGIYEWIYDNKGLPLHANAVFLNLISIEKGVFIHQQQK